MENFDNFQSGSRGVRKPFPSTLFNLELKLLIIVANKPEDMLFFLLQTHLIWLIISGLPGVSFICLDLQQFSTIHHGDSSLYEPFFISEQKVVLSLVSDAAFTLKLMLWHQPMGPPALFNYWYRKNECGLHHSIYVYHHLFIAVYCTIYCTVYYTIYCIVHYTFYYTEYYTVYYTVYCTVYYFTYCTVYYTEYYVYCTVYCTEYYTVYYVYCTVYFTVYCYTSLLKKIAIGPLNAQNGLIFGIWTIQFFL